MQISDNKVSTSKTSSSSTVKLSYNKSGDHSAISNSSMNNQVTSSASKNDTLEHIKRTKKKATRDRQPTNDNKLSAADMSDLTYSLIDDDHIDDQETINVGNLIIDLESSLEKEKIENEQANNNSSSENRPTRNPTNPRSPTSLSTESDASASSLTYRQRAARRRAQQRSPTSMSPCSSSPVNSTPSSPSSSNRVNHFSIGSNNNDTKPMNDGSVPKSTMKSNTKSANKLAKDSTKGATALNASTTNGHTTRTVFKSSSDERGELKMKITREKKVSKNEHKQVGSPTHKSPPGCSSMNNYGHSAESNFERSVSHEELAKSSISSTKECGTSTSIGTITEPECLGPCEPGTSVTLEGIVWQETDGGILVVNVTWRGKTYVGALLDCTRHDWAPPRLCESPSSDIDLKANKGVRTKRIVTRSNGIGLDEKNLLQTTGKLRNGKGRRIVPTTESNSCNKKQREGVEKGSIDNQHTQNEICANQSTSTVTANKEADGIFMEVEHSAVSNETEVSSDTMEKAPPSSPTLIGCNEPNCSKKYRNLNGLQYHQSHAHNGDSNQSNSHNDCSFNEDKNINDCTLDQRSPIASDSHGLLTDLSARDELVMQQRKKRERTPSPDVAVKHDQTTNQLQSKSRLDYKPQHDDSFKAQHLKDGIHKQHLDLSKEIHRLGESARLSPSSHRRDQPYESPHGQKSSAMGGVAQRSSPSLSTLPGSKPSAHSSKQSTQQQAPLPATTEEGMKPSGTSTGPPPAPHQANCYFNPAFMANAFSPYNMQPYFPRPLYDQMTPPTIPTSNAAFLARFMNNMRGPPPSDSPSRLLSPSIPKNGPYPPFKLEAGMPPLPSSMPSMPPMSNPSSSLLTGPLPPMPPLSLPGGPNLRMPSQGDPLLPPSQTQFPPHPTSLNPAMGLPGLGNPLASMGGLPMTNPAEDALAKQFPRRFN